MNTLWDFKVLMILNISFGSKVMIITDDEVDYLGRHILLKVEMTRDEKESKAECYLKIICRSQSSSLCVPSVGGVGGVSSLVSFGCIDNFYLTLVLL